MPIRLAIRELRGGLAGFRILIACLALGVAAIAAVGGVRMAIERGLEDNAAILLGGDAEVEFAYRFASDQERAWMEGIAGEVSEIVDFRSMLGHSGDTERTLVQVKAVDGAYPLYGAVELANCVPLPEALAGTDGLPGIVVEKTLLDSYGLAVGDTVSLGTQDLRIAGELLREPDNASRGIGFGPRVILRRDALADSGLLSEGSLFESSYRLLLPENADLDALRADAEAKFRDTGLQWRDRRNASPGISRFVDRLSAFLVLLGLAGLAVGGVGVSAAVRSHLDGKIETIATLKTLGATGATIFAVYLIQIGVLSAVGIALGLAIGAALPLLAAPLVEASLPIPAEFGLYARPLAEAAIYGALTALIFTLWPLARARDIRAAELFRGLGRRSGLPRMSDVALVLVPVVLLIVIAVWFSGATRLAVTVAGGILGALMILWLSALLIRTGARRAARSRAVNGRPALRWALAALGGPSGETGSVVLSLGLGLSVLAMIGQVDANLRGLVLQELPERAPAFFLVDIQNDQLEGLVAREDAREGIEEIETAPMLRGIVTRINGRPARDVAGPHWALRGDRGVTYAASPPETAKITEGAWWPEDYAGPPLVSFAAEEGAEIGLKLGDEITVNVLGRDLVFRIANFREVDFGTMGINFLMIVDPAALAGAPHSHIATVYADPKAEAPLLRDLAQDYPNVTAVRVRDAIDQVAEILSGIGAATRWGASVTLVTGIIVLIGAAAAGERRRTYESAVLKTLGATRARILASFALRSALLGGAAGCVAMAAGAIGGWWVTTAVMEGDYRFAPASALGIVLGGAVASLLAGLFFALRPLAARPAQVLRARE
jgi:putative ABC transport system permease protein